MKFFYIRIYYTRALLVTIFNRYCANLSSSNLLQIFHPSIVWINVRYLQGCFQLWAFPQIIFVVLKIGFGEKFPYVLLQYERESCTENLRPLVISIDHLFIVYSLLEYTFLGMNTVLKNVCCGNCFATFRSYIVVIFNSFVILIDEKNYILDSELLVLAEKTNRHMRLRELLLQHSRHSTFVVM